MARNNELILVTGLMAILGLAALLVMLTTPGAPEFTPLIEEDDPRDLTHVDPTPPTKVPPAPPELEFVESVAGGGELQPVSGPVSVDRLYAKYYGGAELDPTTKEDCGWKPHLVQNFDDETMLFHIPRGRAWVHEFWGFTDEEQAQILGHLEERTQYVYLEMLYIEQSVKAGDFEVMDDSTAVVPFGDREVEYRGERCVVDMMDFLANKEIRALKDLRCDVDYRGALTYKLDLESKE